MINKKLFLFLLGFATLFLATSCDDDDDDTLYGNWLETYQYKGSKRSHAASFIIDETLYFGLGYNGSRSSGSQYFTDFKSYGGGTNWTSLADFPGPGRQGAFSFAVDGKGYVGCGYYNDTAEIYYNDVWVYDPVINEWDTLADFPGGLRTGAVSFVVGGKAYVAGGHYDSDDTKGDCYEFDPATGTFTAVDDMGFKRTGAFAFVIGTRAYVGGGYDNNLVRQFEYFDAATKSWNGDPASDDDDLRDLYLDSDDIDDIDDYDEVLNLLRRWTTTFVVDDKAYILGGNNGSVLGDCWEYDPTTDIWTEKNSFDTYMSSRQNATAFVLNEVPYIMAGYTGSSYLDDVWYFEPNEEQE